MKEFDMAELDRFDGKEGRPVYIAHRGKVYDVSESKMWRGGVHMRRHQAGGDLTTEISAAPHGLEVFERYPQVGVIRHKKEEGLEGDIPEYLADFLKRYPMLRRHPHPMTVHFPIAFMLATPLFYVLFLLTGVKSFEATAVNCLGAGVAFMPVVVLTGLYTWWINYLARPLRPVHIKLTLSVVMFLVALALFTWRMAAPHILDRFTAGGLIYFVLVLALVPLVSVIGWQGAKLTFPVE